MASYTIVSRDCDERFFGEDDEIVTWKRHVHIRDAAGKVVNTGMGFETTTEERRFVDGVSMGLRVAGHTVEYLEEGKSTEEEPVNDLYDAPRASWSNVRVSA